MAAAAPAPRPMGSGGALTRMGPQAARCGSPSPGWGLSGLRWAASRLEAPQFMQRWGAENRRKQRRPKGLCLVAAAAASQWVLLAVASRLISVQQRHLRLRPLAPGLGPAAPLQPPRCGQAGCRATPAAWPGPAAAGAGVLGVQGAAAAAVAPATCV
jgi:hypothetical protein